MPNRLAAATSPYLRQHADNPIDWWPWCEEALALAHRLDRPILLSIGYSSCHWCHVMAHESFADPLTAAAMNKDFVNIKVDREERPDLDQIYQSAHQLLSGRGGGWPLTLFLSPDGTPFYAGTYFPAQGRFGLPPFREVLAGVAETFATRRRDVEEQNAALRAALARAAWPGSAQAPTHHSDFEAAPLDALRAQLAASFDPHAGGFGDAPKFPRPGDLAFLLHRAHTADDAPARTMALSTLAHMAEGGIHDQLGGGFCRYSTDERWQIPHFEKMLYDNGALLGLYAEAWQIARRPLFARAAAGIAGWAIDEMQSPGGAFYAALDADSDGEEGRYYVWQRDEVRTVLAPEEFAVVERHYGLDAPPNFENRHWHLVVARPLEDVAEALGITAEDAAARLASARTRLLAARDRRPQPGVDDKLLTAWNALMIGGLMRAARVFGRPDWHHAARRALDFVHDRLWHHDRLHATSDGGPGRLNAYLDDHALLIDALLESLQTAYQADDLAFAEELADALLEHFEDRAGGGFFFTRHDHEALIQRPKPIHDGATASGNGVAARALLRLGLITGETRYLDAAERCLQASYAALAQQPAGCASLALALAEQLALPQVAVLRGAAEALDPWLRGLATCHLPDTVALAIPPGTPDLPPVLDKPCGEQVRAWVCRGSVCLPPVDHPDALLERLHADSV